MDSREQPVRVIVAARSVQTRSHIVSILREGEGFVVVGAAAEQAAAAASTLVADVLLAVVSTSADIDSAVGLLEGDAAVVLLVEAPIAEAETDGLPRGRDGVSILFGPVERRQLLAAVGAAAAGLLVRQPREEGVARASGGLEAAGGRQGLTQREREVLLMIAEGLANKAIAYELGITSNTVKFHVASIMQKLGAASRTEAVTLGLRFGLIFL